MNCKMDVANGVINFKRTVIDARVSFVNDRNVEKSTGNLKFLQLFAIYQHNI